MAQGTDLFNSTKGQFSQYTTLLGGKIPETTQWFFESYETADNVNVISGTLGASNGALSIASPGGPNDTYEFSQYQNVQLKNCAVLLEYKTGDVVEDSTIGVFGRKTIGGDYLYGLIGHNDPIKIFKYESSVDVEIASSGSVTLVPNKTYWIVFIVVENKVRCELWGEDPRTAVSPLTTATATLSESETTYYDVESEIGVTKWIPKSAEATIQSIEVGQAFIDNTNSIDEVVSKKHVDIRDFINYRYPVRFRTIKELNQYNITEKAFSQTITLDNTTTGGTFVLYFYPSDEDPYVPIEIRSLNIDTGTGQRLPFAYNATNQEIKDALNYDLNALPKFSVTEENPIVNVESLINSSEMTLMVEFSESFGEISLLRMGLGLLTPTVISEENYESSTKIGTFYPTIFDSQKYIETSDPLDKTLTLDDLRMEFKYKNENWALYSGSGGTSAPAKSYFRDGDLYVGKIISQNNRRGAHLKFARAMKRAEKTVAGSWSVHVQSFTKAVNCKTIGTSSNLHISIPFAEYPWDPGSNSSVLDIEATGCYVQFTSDPLGLFSDQGGSSLAESYKVRFKDNLYYESGSPNSSNVEFIAPMTAFEYGTTGGFNFSTITAVRIFFKSTFPSEVSDVKIMGIRAITQSRVDDGLWMTAEINTLEQNVSSPVLGYGQNEESIVPMISGSRLETIASDPSPIDSKQAVIFQTGAGLASNPGYNKIMIFAREQEFDDLKKSSWLTVEYSFNLDPDAALRRYKTLRVLSDDGSDVLCWDIHPGGVYEDVYNPATEGISYLPELKSERNYEISGNFAGNSIAVQIQELTAAEQPQQIIFDAPVVSSAEWGPISGRIGWYFEFADKDMYVSAYDLESAAYAILRTKQFISETPVEGAQLFTVDSGDKNLFEEFFPLSPLDRVYVDNQKTSTGVSSYVFESFGQAQNPGVISNQFTVNDWNHIYIEFDIWVPRVLRSEEKRPRFGLRPVEQPEGTDGTDIFSGLVPLNAPIAFDFVAGAWSHVSFDMRGTQAKNGDYYLTIFSNGDGSDELSTFRNKWWIDNIQISTQTIEWEMRAVENGSWTPFRKNVNRQYGALHLSENQTGKNVQLQARALTEDAWIAEYTLIPKYISSGRILDTNVYILENQ